MRLVLQTNEGRFRISDVNLINIVIKVIHHFYRAKVAILCVLLFNLLNKKVTINLNK